MIASIAVSYPPLALNPNRSHGKHWGTLSRLKKAYKLEVWAQAKAEGLTAPDSDRIRLILHFHPPLPHRARDDDNAEAAFKAGRDGLAEALGVNDSRFVVEKTMHPAGSAGKHGALIIGLEAG